MIGIRTGLKTGPMGGARTGIGLDDIASGSTTLTLGITPSADPTPAGDNFTYAVLVTNTGSVTANTLSCAITLDSTLTLVSASGTGWTCNAVGQVVTCTRATLAVGAAPTITVTVTAGNTIVTATTTGACTSTNAPTANASNNVSVAGTTETLSIADNASGAVITGADAFQYSCQYTNTGSNNALLVSVAITLDASLTYVSSSGTGWSITPVGQVVTCTQASIAPGAANAILINVTTGTSALTATTTGAATSTDAPTANASHDVAVALVSKDATSHIYCPAASAEWSAFITRKGLTLTAPSGGHLCQEASGNLLDWASVITLTASGTAASYAQAVTGWSRLAVKIGADGATTSFTSTQVALSDISAASQTTLAYVLVPAVTPGGVRSVISHGTTADTTSINATPVARCSSAGNITLGTSNPVAATTVRPWLLKTDKTNTADAAYNDQDKMVATHSGTITGKKMVIGSAGGGAIAGGYLFTAYWLGSGAEISDANVKALLQALGFTIPWS